MDEDTQKVVTPTNESDSYYDDDVATGEDLDLSFLDEDTSETEEKDN